MSGFTAVVAHLPSALGAEGGYTTSETSGPVWPFFLLMGIWGLVVLGTYGFGIWALVDTIRHRDDEFEAIGSSRVMWLVLLLVGLLACQPVGLVAGLVFVVRVRSRLLAWRRAHPQAPGPYVAYVPYVPPGGYGPPPGWPPPSSWGGGPPPPPPPPPPPAGPTDDPR